MMPDKNKILKNLQKNLVKVGKFITNYNLKVITFAKTLSVFWPSSGTM